MKTPPIIIAGLGKREKESAVVMEYLRKNRLNAQKPILINISQQKQIPELYPEKQDINILEKIKQFNKEIFGE